MREAYLIYCKTTEAKAELEKLGAIPFSSDTLFWDKDPHDMDIESMTSESEAREVITKYFKDLVSVGIRVGKRKMYRLQGEHSNSDKINEMIHRVEGPAYRPEQKTL